MGLADVLKARACPQKELKFSGVSCIVRGCTQRRRAELEAKCRDKKSGRLDAGRMECMLLHECVRDSDGQQVFENFDEWNDLPASDTAVLKAAMFDVCGFDDDDLGKFETSSD